MGMDAKARLWYGVRGAVPENVLIEVEEPADGSYEKKVDGIHIDAVYVYDTQIGVGGDVAYAWWGEKEDPVDLDERLPAVKAAVDKFLNEYGVSGPRGLWLTADYS